MSDEILTIPDDESATNVDSPYGAIGDDILALANIGEIDYTLTWRIAEHVTWRDEASTILDIALWVAETLWDQVELDDCTDPYTPPPATPAAPFGLKGSAYGGASA